MTGFKFKEIPAEVEQQLIEKIEAYEQARVQDRETLSTINDSIVKRFAEELGMHVILDEGSVYEDSFHLMIIKGQDRIKVRIFNFMTNFCMVMKEDTNLEFSAAVNKQVFTCLFGENSLNEQLQTMVKDVTMESDQLAEGAEEAERRLSLVATRRRATLKWFIRPVLMTEEDIDAFLDSVSTGTLNDIMDDLVIPTSMRENAKETIKEALTL